MVEKWMPPIHWDGDAVAILDQRLLPHREFFIRCAAPKQVAACITNMAIRGAPAIGVAGAMGVAMGAAGILAADIQTFARKLVRICDMMKRARPTGNNLGWAVDRVYAILAENPGADVPTLKRLMRERADAILRDDVAANLAIGAFGKEVIPKGAGILTYCNAGALATADYGTAVGVIRAAYEADPTIQVYSCETRPYLQGARLTSFELHQAGIPVTLITDNSVGSLMQQGKAQVAVVGADRIAANGDTANKIGTYMVAVLAGTHGIPFYVAAPRSTIDPSIPDGSGIPIEYRDPKEITHFRGKLVAPAGVPALNPAFDVTPNRYISGIITEVGVLRKPFTREIRRSFTMEFKA